VIKQNDIRAHLFKTKTYFAIQLFVHGTPVFYGKSATREAAIKEAQRHLSSMSKDIDILIDNLDTLEVDNAAH